MLQSRQHRLLTRFLNLPRKEHLIQNRIHLVEVEDEIQLAHVSKERIQNLDEEVNSLEVRELVVVCVDTGAEEETGVSAVDDF